MKRKAVQTKINAVSFTENKHFSYIHSSIPRVPKEIGSLEKRINETFSNVRQHDANILKSDEELETARSAKKEKYVVIAEELEQKFQTVEPQESEIIFETNHFVFEGPKISCYQIESYIVSVRKWNSLHCA